MKQHYIDEKTGISYTLQGDYYLPNLVPPTKGETQTSGKLGSHLVNIDEQAENMFFRLVEQMAESEGVTEHLKAVDQMVWVREMNSICNRAEEIVKSELIYN